MHKNKSNWPYGIQWGPRLMKTNYNHPLRKTCNDAKSSSFYVGSLTRFQ